MADVDDRATVIPLETLFAEDGVSPNQSDGFDASELMYRVPMIFAVDNAKPLRALVFGRGLLREVAQGQDAQKVEVMHVGIDCGPSDDDLERLCALVLVVKGHHEYRDEWEPFKG